MDRGRETWPTTVRVFHPLSTLQARRLEVFHKVNGQWKVIHTHISAPMDPKTGMTEMNLKSWRAPSRSKAARVLATQQTSPTIIDDSGSAKW